MAASLTVNSNAVISLINLFLTSENMGGRRGQEDQKPVISLQPEEMAWSYTYSQREHHHPNKCKQEEMARHDRQVDMCWTRHPASTTYFHQSAMTISLQDSEKLDYSRTTEQKQTDSITHLFPIALEIFNN